jgi:uncharacterized membrane protein YebE (DUF533 family)
VKAAALAMASGTPSPDPGRTAAQGRAVVPVAKGAQQGSAGVVLAAGGAAAEHMHSQGMSAGPVVSTIVVAAIAAFASYVFWNWWQKRQQEKLT